MTVKPKLHNRFSIKPQSFILFTKLTNFLGLYCADKKIIQRFKTTGARRHTRFFMRSAHLVHEQLKICNSTKFMQLQRREAVQDYKKVKRP